MTAQEIISFSENIHALGGQKMDLDLEKIQLPIAVVMASNSNCQISHWSLGGLYEPNDSYIADSMAALGLNPKYVGQYLDFDDTPRDMECKGTADAEEFALEHIENPSAGRLTILANVNAYQYLQWALRNEWEGSEEELVLEIGEGARYGILDDMDGVGGLFEATLKKPLRITHNKDIKGDGYNCWQVNANYLHSQYGCDVEANIVLK